MKRCILIIIMLPILLQSQQDSNRLSFGIFGGYSLNIHSADFKKIPDCPNCSPGFKDGNGSGLNAGLIVDIPLNDIFTLSNKLFYKNISGKLVSTETTTIIVEGIKQDGEFEHSFDADLDVIGFEPSIKFPLMENLNLNFGFLFSYLMTKNYSQVEKISKPSDFGTFLDKDGNDTHSRERNKFSGEMQAANSLYIAPMLSVSYKMPMDKKGELFMEPEAMFHYGLTNIVNDDLVNKWTVNSISLVLALKYSPLPSKPEIIEEFKRIEHIDTLRIPLVTIKEDKYSRGKDFIKKQEDLSGDVLTKTDIITRTDTIFYAVKTNLEATITAVGVSKEGIEIPNPIFKIEEFVFNRLDPLLNYVFFEDNSSEIPERYKLLKSGESGKFNMDSLFQISTLEIYYDMLNIVGSRLVKYPNAKITLKGCISDQGAEKGKKDISAGRIESIKNYLINVWKIDEKRISSKINSLPDKPSTPVNEPEKIAENRRVEILSDDYRILEPVYIENIQRKSNPPTVRFKMDYKSDSNINEWEVIAYQNSPEDKDAYKIKGNNIHPDKLDWVLESDQLTIPKLKKPIKYQYTLSNTNSQNYTTELQELPVDVIHVSEKRVKRIDDYEIEKFSLILFEFDKSDIEGNNNKIIEMIKKRLQPDSKIEIKGFTDRTGDEAYNKNLSEKRSANVKTALGRNDASSVGIGEQELIYNNDIPEGRFYCRTVEITVINKVK